MPTFLLKVPLAFWFYTMSITGCQQLRMQQKIKEILKLTSVFSYKKKGTIVP
jgi:hypothetical protein